MPVHMPRARPSEVATFGVAGVTGFVPFYLMLPSGEDRIARQTAKLAPRLERNMSYIAPRAHRLIDRVEPRVERTFHRIDNRLPLERMAQTLDRRIKNGVDRAERYQRKHQ
ncbi:hypothetical protein F4809DRAFT_623825 [Biscogniauxia mediterranea]|nr:hypothetical protein F4809DRAFT_623825 [Biscogniauxia mediterranea]